MRIKYDELSISFKLTNYTGNKREWTKCDASFAFKRIKYAIKESEVFLCEEVIFLRDALKKLLENKYKSTTQLGFAEPDFEFELIPLEKFKDNNGNAFIQDISLLWRIYFWSKNGLTNNYLTFTLYRKHIKQLYDYLTGVIKKD